MADEVTSAIPPRKDSERPTMGDKNSNSSNSNSRSDRGGSRGRGMARGRGQGRGQGRGRGGSERGQRKGKGFGANDFGGRHKKADMGRGEYECVTLLLLLITKLTN
jgi:hypothetical protein